MDIQTDTFIEGDLTLAGLNKKGNHMMLYSHRMKKIKWIGIWVIYYKNANQILQKLELVYYNSEKLNLDISIRNYTTYSIIIIIVHNMCLTN